jgi:predicted Zn finger-like uncharacterized protein
MIIVCQSCSRRFRLDENLLKPEGSRVRCSRCGEVFTVRPAVLEADLDPAGSDSWIAPLERRKSARIPVSIPAMCNTTNPEGRSLELHIGAIKEISRGGAQIELFRRTISEVMGLSFIGIDHQEIRVKGKVRHSSEDPSGWMRIGFSLQGSPFHVRRFVTQAIKIRDQSVVVTHPPR